jgi:hypothetical protein
MIEGLTGPFCLDRGRGIRLFFNLVGAFIAATIFKGNVKEYTDVRSGNLSNLKLVTQNFKF